MGDRAEMLCASVVVATVMSQEDLHSDKAEVVPARALAIRTRRRGG